MKIIGRTLIILAAAFIVVGAAAAFAQTDLAAQLLPGGRGGEFVGDRFPEGTLPEGFNPQEFRRGDVDGRFPGGERRGERPGAFGLFSFMALGRNLLTIALIILAVVGLERLFSWRKRRPGVPK